MHRNALGRWHFGLAAADNAAAHKVLVNRMQMALLKYFFLFFDYFLSIVFTKAIADLKS